MTFAGPLKQRVGSWLLRHRPGLLFRYQLMTRNHNLEPELWLIPRLARRDCVAVDIGGNMGLWMMQMSRHAVRVHCFEPNPVCIAAIARILPRNGVLHRVALSTRAGRAKLRFDPENTGVGTIEDANTFAGNSGVKTVEAVEVVTAPLDDFALRNVALVKIDVEGHEEAVIAGGLETLERERPVVICEIEERHNPGGLARLRAMFAARTYGAWALEGGQLRSLEAIEAEGAVALADAQGINNFVFVPAERKDLISG